MKILVTGGAGFIGSNLVSRSLAAGHQVTVLDDLSDGFRENVPEGCRFIEGSILEQAPLTEAVAGQDSIVHLGGLGSVPRSIRQPVRYHEVNATGTVRVLEAARAAGVNHVIFASSSSVYGKDPAMPNRERDGVAPVSPYAASKLAAEQYLLSYQESYGLEALAFRFFNVFGPGQRPDHPYAAVVPLFLAALIRGQELTVFGDGTSTRDYTYVGTLCDVILRAVTERISHDTPVNLAFGTQVSIRELIACMEEVTGLEAKVRLEPPRAGDIAHSSADGSTLASLMPGIIPATLAEGIRDTYDWIAPWLARTQENGASV